MELCLRTEIKIKNLTVQTSIKLQVRFKVQDSWSLSHTQNPSRNERKLIPDTVISHSQMSRPLKKIFYWMELLFLRYKLIWGCQKMMKLLVLFWKLLCFQQQDVRLRNISICESKTGNLAEIKQGQDWMTGQ